MCTAQYITIGQTLEGVELTEIVPDGICMRLAGSTKDTKQIAVIEIQL